MARREGPGGMIWEMILQGEALNMRLSDDFVARTVHAQTGHELQVHSYALGGNLSSIHYLQIGDTHKPLLILLHGTPGSGSNYLSYLSDSTLLDHFQLIAADRPGMGYSDFGTAVPSLAEQSRMLNPLLDRHSAPAVFLLGHSYGGSLAIRMAMDLGNRIHGLYVIAGSSDPAHEPEGKWRRWFDGPLSHALLPTALRTCNQEMMTLRSDLEEMVPLWSRITAKTTVFQGLSDFIVPSVHADFTETKLLSHNPANVFRIKGAGHNILWSHQPEIVASLISQLSPIT